MEPKWDVVRKQLRRRFPVKTDLVLHDVEDTNMSDPNLGLAKVSVYLENQSKPIEIQDGYPTIYKIVNGKLSYYNGPREIGPMIIWAMDGLRKTSKKTRNANKSRNRKTRRR